MAVLANSRSLVPTPGTRPRYGLFSVANGPLDLPLRTRLSGLEFETANCELPVGLSHHCDPADAVTKEFIDHGYDLVTADPFTVRSSFTCAPVGMTDERFRRLVMERLKNGEQAAVERIFSEETFGQTPGLPGASTVDSGCDAPNLASQIGALEEALYAVYGPAGVLHVPARAGAAMFAEHQLVKNGTRWETALGTAVSIGNYANESPAGAAATDGQAWIYITGQVTVWHTPDEQVFIPTMAESLDRLTNQVTGQAEREYIVAFECASFAALATICTITP